MWITLILKIFSLKVKKFPVYFPQTKVEEPTLSIEGANDCLEQDIVISTFARGPDLGNWRSLKISERAPKQAQCWRCS